MPAGKKNDYAVPLDAELESVSRFLRFTQVTIQAWNDYVVETIAAKLDLVCGSSAFPSVRDFRRLLSAFFLALMFTPKLSTPKVLHLRKEGMCSPAKRLRTGGVLSF